MTKETKLSDEWQARFWTKVDKTFTCWTWLGELTRDGYGKFTITIAPKVYRQFKI